MKKVLFLLCACLLCFQAGAKLTNEQKKKAKATVDQFCNLLSDFARSDAYIGNMNKMIDLCSNNNIPVYDDLKSGEHIFLQDYLNIIVKDYKNSLTISFNSEPSDKKEFPVSYIEMAYPEIDFKSPKLPVKVQPQYICVLMKKRIHGQGVKNESVDYCFVLNMKDYKIYATCRSNIQDEEEGNFWIKRILGMSLYAVAKEKGSFEMAYFYNAAKRFHQAACEGDVESAYYFAIMCFNGQGYRYTYDMNENIKKTIEGTAKTPVPAIYREGIADSALTTGGYWLSKAINYGHPEAMKLYDFLIKIQQ